MKSKKPAVKSSLETGAKSAQGTKFAKAARPAGTSKGAPGKLARGVKAAAKKTAKKVATPKPRARTLVAKHAAGAHPRIYYRLNTLLHIVRNIAHYEDQLCTILHEIKTAGAADATLSHELADVLEDLPSSDFTQELQALRALLSRSGQGGGAAQA